MPLFTVQELADFIETDVNTARAVLLRDLVVGLIADAAGDTWDEDTASVTIKALALTVAARAYSNPQFLESQTRAIDDYSATSRWSADSVGLFLAPDEQAAVAALYGAPSAAFTISPYYSPPETALESWA